MKLIATTKLIFVLLVIGLANSAQAAITSEDYTNSHSMNALFVWAVDPSDMTFDIGASDFSGLGGWTLDTDPYSNGDNGAWVVSAPDVATGGGAVAAGGATVTVGFDYVVGGGLFGTSVFQYQYALVLWDGASATVQASGARTLVRGFVNTGFGIGPSINATQLNQINTYLVGVAPVPIPNSVILMSSAIGFLGFSRRALPTRS